MLIKKILDVSILVTTTVFNTKIGEIENTIPDTYGLTTNNALIQRLKKLRAKQQMLVV